MKKSVFFAICFIFFLIPGSCAALTIDTLNVGPFGKVYLYSKSNTPENIIIMISGDGGWRFGVVGFAEEFSGMNALVIGVDILRYFRELRQRSDNCYNVAADFVNLATVVEKRHNFPDYKPAVLMGYSSGATLVYGVLAQSRPGTFIGGISLGFCPDIHLPKMLCQINGLTVKAAPDGKNFILQPDTRLGNPWIVLNGKLDKICNYSMVAEFVSKTADAELVTLPDVGHGFAKWSDFMPQWKDAYYRLLEKYYKSKLANTNIDQLKDLPLSITNAKISNKEAPVALFISGDGGWYSFEQLIADNLANLGIPTIGLDAKKYFWNRKSPDETARDMAKALDYYSRKWERNKYILIGYSLGAEIVPFIETRLPEEIESRIESSVLLSPAATTDFEIHITSMLGMGNRQNTYNVIDEINKLKTGIVLAIFGEDEKSQVPKQLTGKSVKISFLPGDHHYKFDLPLVIRTMRNNNAI